jgi:hypothetical protein
MAHQISGIDHVLIAVADPHLVQKTFRRLGFFVSPPFRNSQSGTQSYSLSFAADHVEILASDGDAPAGRSPLQMLDGEAGRLMGLGLGSRDIQVSYESLHRVGIDVQGVFPVTRHLVGQNGDGTCLNSVVRLPEGGLPGVSATVCYSSEPDCVRRPEWRGHPNTAQGIVSTSLILDNPEAAIPSFNKLFGPAACTPTDTLVTVHTGHGLIFLATAEGFDDLHPSLDVRLPPPPAMAVLTIGVADIDKAAAVLAANGVVTERRGGHLGVPAEDVFGIGLEFVER